MPKRIADTRKYQQMSLEEADELFQQLALKELEVKKLVATCDKHIATIKASLEIKISPINAEIKELANQLAEYIKTNSKRFIKPRQRQTNFGKYGMRNVSEVIITDEQAVIDYAKLKNFPLFKIEYKINKKEVEKLLIDEKKVPGAYRTAGEITTYVVAKLKENEND